MLYRRVRVKRLCVAVVDHGRRLAGRFACRRISYGVLVRVFRALLNNPVGRRHARIKARGLLDLLDRAGVDYDPDDTVVASAMRRHLFPWGYYRLADCPRKEFERFVGSCGLEHLISSLGEGRGVLLAANHHGPSRTTQLYLRANGYRVHVLRRLNRFRGAERLGLRESAPPEGTVDLCLQNDNSPGFVQTMTRIRHLLRSGEIVLAALDGVAGRTKGLCVPLMGSTYRLQIGVAVAAALSNALVIPVHTVLKTDGKVEIHFARPIAERRSGETPLGHAENIVRAYADSVQRFIAMEPGSVSAHQFGRSVTTSKDEAYSA